VQLPNAFWLVRYRANKLQATRKRNNFGGKSAVKHKNQIQSKIKHTTE